MVAYSSAKFAQYALAVTSNYCFADTSTINARTCWYLSGVHLIYDLPTNSCSAIAKGIFSLDSVWMRIEFAFSWCVSNANSVHVNWVHTAKFHNQIVTELLLACHTHCSPSNNFHSGFIKPTFYMYQNTLKSVQLFEYLVTSSRQHGTWI